MSGLDFYDYQPRRLLELMKTGEDIEIETIYIDRQEVHPAIVQAVAINDPSETVVRNVNVRIFANHLFVGLISRQEVLESLLVAFNEQARPAVQDQGSSVGEMYPVPRTELTTQFGFSADNAEYMGDYPFLAILRKAVPAIVEKTTHTPKTSA